MNIKCGSKFIIISVITQWVICTYNDSTSLRGSRPSEPAIPSGYSKYRTVISAGFGWDEVGSKCTNVYHNSTQIIIVGKNFVQGDSQNVLLCYIFY